MIYVIALLLGAVTGMRTMMAPTAVSWAARLGFIDLGGSVLAFLGHALTPWLAGVLAVGELVGDKLPATPSRTTPLQFAARILAGGLAGAALGAARGSAIGGSAAGIAGAVVGTLGGRALRGRLATVFGRDLPAALVEDGIALVSAALLVVALRATR